MQGIPVLELNAKTNLLNLQTMQTNVTALESGLGTSFSEMVQKEINATQSNTSDIQKSENFSSSEISEEITNKKNISSEKIEEVAENVEDENLLENALDKKRESSFQKKLAFYEEAKDDFLVDDELVKNSPESFVLPFAMQNTNFSENEKGKNFANEFTSLKDEKNDDTEFFVENFLQSKKNIQENAPVFTVIDERTKSNTQAKQEKNSNAKLVSNIQRNGNNVEVAMDISKSFVINESDASLQIVEEGTVDFQAMLSQELASSADDIVKAATIILKDNNMGTIKMTLTPESLGNVKIQLELSDKMISGKIVVASSEAFGAFKESAGDLKQSFQNQGFDVGEFVITYAESQNGNGNFSNSGENESYAFAQGGKSYDDAQFVDAIPTGNGMYITAEHTLSIVA
ncbi:MAG: flagellar hook-length control protein FliK [Treponema sp.]|nr:flagellar hook-length control protein FliK [Treponema sp.]